LSTGEVVVTMISPGFCLDCRHLSQPGQHFKKYA